MTEKEYLVALSSFIPFGSRRLQLLLNYFGSAQKTWLSKEKDLSVLGINKNILRKFLEYRKDFDSESFFKDIKELSVTTLTIADEDYPSNLREIDDAPPVLYVRGKLSKSDSNSIAIVGSRKVTSYGKFVAESFATNLSNMGITIVSGLAFGVDLEAHKAAVRAGGRCIAVLAGGVDIITPRSNEWLGLKIIENGGAIVSEFPLGTMPQKQYFPFRNRIISGLSKAVLVVEGAIKSGTIHTAKHAANQGRAVFAIPGPITSPMSEATNFLIQNGAKLTTKPQDILEELDMQIKVDRETIEKVMPGDKYEQKLFDILDNEEKHLDEIVRVSGLQVSQVSGKLTVMELKGIVKHMGNGVYKKA